MNYKGVKDRVYDCQQCGNPFTRTYYSTRPPMFCSRECKLESQKCTWKQLEQGKVVYHDTQRRLLSEQHGYKCSECNITEWNGKPLTLQVDHIDGDPSNNKANNLRLMCPNCHSQTETYKGGNKNNPKMDKRSRWHRQHYKKKMVGVGGIEPPRER